MDKVSVRRVDIEQLQEIIEKRSPRGCFLTKTGHKWVAVDNTTSDAWTEEFDRKRQAIRWLRGEFEVGEAAKSRNYVNTVEKLITAAACQGLEIDADEADIILGYLEGHEYSLMVDDNGMTVRHDEQYGCQHRGDEPYSIQRAIRFCQEMNEGLIQDNESQDKPDREYLFQLRKDEQALDALMVRI